MRRRTVLSLEQALSLPSATLRFAQLGWRVIRIEPTPQDGGMPGDPNRYIGGRIVDDDRRSYYIAPNVGKEAIALNLKDARGREALLRLVRALAVDVFCCNTLPSRYQALGIDYATLAAAKPDLVWAGISAMGPEFPEVPGYDPVLQALCGYMELTGDPAGAPTLMGLPVIDLKAGDEVYASVLRALLERADTGRGAEIHVSMLQAAASWLVTVLPLLDMGCEADEVTRAGNAHRKFVPSNVYPARDGFVYLAIGSDAQWRRFTDIPKFASLKRDGRTTNEGRQCEREALYRDIGAITARHCAAELLADLRAATIPATRILDVRRVRELPQLAGKLTRTRLPDGRWLRMQPMAVDVPGALGELAFPSGYGADTRRVLAEGGFASEEIRTLEREGVIA